MTSPLDRVPELAAWLAASGLAELELTGPDGRVGLRSGRVNGNANGRHPEEDRPPLTSAQDDDVDIVTSPGVGRFLSAHPLRKEPFARPDEPTVAGEPLGLLRIDGLLLPVPSPRDGIVARVVAEDGALVGYGDPIVALWKD